jgi:hypothetical protein
MPDEMPGAPAAPMIPPPPPQVPPGPTAPATVAPIQTGRMMEGRIKANLGLDQLEQAAGMLGGTNTEEGRELLSFIVKARKRFGKAEPDLQKQQLKIMGESIPGVQQPTPLQGDQFQKSIKQHQATQGMPGAAA